jgi:phospholipid/cholesterol/gamma-HCH transport system ATP-binding protein
VASTIVETIDVRKTFDPLEVLRGVSFALAKGETLVVMGGSGSGKTVLLRLVAGLIRPDAGQIRVFGRAIELLSEEELLPLRRRMGFVFQGAALFDSLSVYENVAYPFREHTSLGEPEIRQRVVRNLSLVGLGGEALGLLPAELSGGMRKRVGIARAIAGEPTYLLYDEPTSGLDPVNADVIDGLIERLQSELGVTSVVVSHDVRGSFRVADRVALLWQSKIRADGKPEEVLQSRDPAVQQFLERDLEMALIQAEADEGSATRREEREGPGGA